MGKSGITGIFFLLATVSIVRAGGWELSWSDEFDSTALSERNWKVYTNPFSSGILSYTPKHDTAGANLFVRQGNLIIETRKAYSIITSGSVTTKGIRSFKYGRIETRMRLPKGKGFWPSMFLVGLTGAWPACGEIDIVEAKVSVPNTVYGAFFYNTSVPSLSDSVQIDSARNLHDDFHTYAIEWNTDSIRWYFDTVNYQTLVKSNFPGAPVDSPYYCQIELAVPYQYGPYPDTAAYPESLIVDYVREYRWNTGTGVMRPAAVTTGKRLPCSIASKGGGITLRFALKDEYAISLFEPGGRLVASVKGVGELFRLDAGNRRAGVYLLRVTSRAASFTKRVDVVR